MLISMLTDNSFAYSMSTCKTTGINRTMYKAGKLEAEGYDVSKNRVFNAIYGNYSLGMMFRAGSSKHYC